MANYISSNENRFYVEYESGYGQAAVVGSGHRIPAVKLTAKQVKEKAARRDKTGGRTFSGLPAGVRRNTTYELQTYLTAWTDQTNQPGYGPLFQAGMGSAPLTYAGGAILSVSNGGLTLHFAGSHGLTTGQAVVFGGEMRFVSAIADSASLVINAPFTIQPSVGSPMSPTITYKLGNQIGSTTIYDFWDPTNGVHRILSGAAVGKLGIAVNADFHEFTFSGPSADMVDSASFSAGQIGLASFPAEPALSGFDYTIVPGHMGQVWLGNAPDQFFTLTSASVQLDNAVDGRNREFGSDTLRSVVGGQRHVSAQMSLYQTDGAATKGLYQAARQGSPIPVMFQLGQQASQLFGVYMKSVQPEVPQYDDKEARLQWHFSDSRAQGTDNDELVIAFG